VLCLPLSLLAQHGSTSYKSVGIRFMDVPLAKALETASVLNKPVFIDCYTVWCGPCKYLSSDVFPDKRVGDFYNEKFICLQIDMEKGEGLEIAKKYEIKSYPTLLFLDANGEVMHRDMGSRSVDNFIKLGETALNPEKNSASIIKKIKNGEVTAATVTYTLDNASRNIKLTIGWLDQVRPHPAIAVHVRDGLIRPRDIGLPRQSVVWRILTGRAAKVWHLRHEDICRCCRHCCDDQPRHRVQALRPARYHHIIKQARRCIHARVGQRVNHHAIDTQFAVGTIWHVPSNVVLQTDAAVKREMLAACYASRVVEYG
jgi:thiol-disulfide isomerase/thioredoxin